MGCCSCDGKDDVSEENPHGNVITLKLIVQLF